MFLIGDSAADFPTAAGNDSIDGRDGNDTLFGDNTPSVEPITSVDTVGGSGRLAGGAGDDTLFAGPANDARVRSEHGQLQRRGGKRHLREMRDGVRITVRQLHVHQGW